MPTNNLQTGRKSGIGPSGVKLTDTDLVAQNGIIIYTDIANTDYVYIGESGLTTDSADATDGFPLSSGDSIFLQHRNPEEIYVRTTTDSNQKLWWIVQ